MARASRNSKIDSRTARAKLKAQPKSPYWSPIGKGLALGYCKGDKLSAWVSRIDTGAIYPNGKHKYDIKNLNGVKPDDFEDADGQHVLDYFQAQDRVRAIAQGERKKEQTGDENIETFTVRQALENYCAEYDATKGGYTADMRQRLAKHISPTVSRKPVAELTLSYLNQLRNSWVRKTDDPEQKRKSRDTANRLQTIVKAGLNHAAANGKAINDHVWRNWKPFPNVDAPRPGFLTTPEAKRLINVCDPDFRSIVRAALLTGCRYGEIIAMRVGDVNLESASVHVPITKNNKPHDAFLTDEGTAFFTRAIAGKRRDELVFTRYDGEPWGSGHQTRRIKEACQRANIDPPVSFHILRHSYAAALAKAGVPLQYIARALNQSDTRTTERHYAHLLPTDVAAMIKQKMPKYGIKTDNVKALK